MRTSQYLLSTLMIDLPADSAFLQANLHPDNLDAAIRSVES